MHIIWHIMKKDLRRNRWLLLAMAIVLVLKAIMVSVVITAAGEDNYYLPSAAFNGVEIASYIQYLLPLPKEEALILLQDVNWYADIYLLMIVILRILKEDSAVDEQSGWRTRPISREQMLTAKILFIGLAGFALPLILQAVVGNSITAHDTYHYPRESPVQYWYNGLLNVALIQAGWTAVAVAIATLWRSHLIGAGMVFLTVMAMTFVMIAGMERNDPAHYEMMVMLIYSGMASSAAIGTVMYLKLNRALGFALYGSTLVAASLVIFLS